jgi:hypothetical protein
MALFKKKEAKKELPEMPMLPEMPSFPELPKEKEEPLLRPLPSFPPMIPIVPKPFPQMEQIRVPVRPMVQEISEERETRMPEMPAPMRMPEMIRREEPIFVKIDKYREALADLEMIKRKLHETSSLLEKIKETRSREEEELNIWIEEINVIKEKISLIDKKLFSV